MTVAYISYYYENVTTMTGCKESHSYHPFPYQQCGGCGVNIDEKTGGRTTGWDGSGMSKKIIF